MPAVNPVTAKRGATKPADDPITWGPIVAVLLTVVIYFLSQFFGTLLLVGFARLAGVGHAQIEAWSNQVGPQFLYIVLIEGLTLGLLWWFLRHCRANFKTLGLVGKPHWRDVAYVFIGFAIYFPVLLMATGLAKVWFPQINLEQSQQIGFEGAHGAALLIVFISLVVLPPFTEELLTRGFLFLGLRKRLPVAWAALLTSVIFASAHLQPGDGKPLLWAAAVDTFVLSMVLVWLRQRTGRLWSSIGLHMLKNSIAFAVLFIFVS